MNRKTFLPDAGLKKKRANILHDQCVPARVRLPSNAAYRPARPAQQLPQRDHRRRSRSVQRSGKDNVPFDDRARLVHFLLQHRIANHPRRVPNVAAGLVEPDNAPDDGALLHVGEIGNLCKRDAPGLVGAAVTSSASQRTSA